ncbi:hypothetical protein SAMN02745171_01734 [Porphyromonas circumdentaria]|uniref:Uncharacterized protein n=1 Tax=Porphyromonas circumdentaria TaxID=29524 RepID=A0A1T4Q8H5_9PORP|nr:hypothetical protein SAMN02745171_01734 [Porphyromonas circumdentaria]
MRNVRIGEWEDRRSISFHLVYQIPFSESFWIVPVLGHTFVATGLQVDIIGAWKLTVLKISLLLRRLLLAWIMGQSLCTILCGGIWILIYYPSIYH